VLPLEVRVVDVSLRVDNVQAVAEYPAPMMLNGFEQFPLKKLQFSRQK
jgi:hypothetical protein